MSVLLRRYYIVVSFLYTLVSEYCSSQLSTENNSGANSCRTAGLTNSLKCGGKTKKNYFYDFLFYFLAKRDYVAFG